MSAEFTIEHETQRGNKIVISGAWVFDESGRWGLRYMCSVDGKGAEDRGEAHEKDGILYRLIHVRDDAYGIPKTKWNIPRCPISNEWWAFLEILKKRLFRTSSSGEATPIEIRKATIEAARAVLESDTAEGKTARDYLNTGRRPYQVDPTMAMVVSMDGTWRPSPMMILVNEMTGRWPEWTSSAEIADEKPSEIII